MEVMERRTLLGEVRALSEDGQDYVSGTGIVFGQWSDDLGGFTEMIQPGAADGALEADMAVCGNHDPNFLLGRSGNGTAAITTDMMGVYYRAAINADDPLAASMLAKVKRGDVSGSSFQFRVETDIWEQDEAGATRRTITKLAYVPEMGPVVFPAYSQTDAQARVSPRAAEIASRMLEVRSRGEMTADDGAFFSEHGANVKITTREGKVLSATNVDALKTALDHHQQCGDLIQGVIDSSCNTGGAPEKNAQEATGRRDIARRRLDLKAKSTR